MQTTMSHIIFNKAVKGLNTSEQSWALNYGIMQSRLDGDRFEPIGEGARD